MAANQITELEEYRRQEHIHLHDDAMRKLDRQSTIEIYTVLACAAVYSFAVTAKLPAKLESLALVLWWLPFVISVLAYARWISITKIIWLIGDYIEEKYERRMHSMNEANAIGWVKYLRSKTKDQQPSARTIWGLFIFLNMLTAMGATIAITD